jgi:hypothetical protein
MIPYVHYDPIEQSSGACTPDTDPDADTTERDT